MPLATDKLFPAIAKFRDEITSAEIRAVARNRLVRVVQTSRPASPSIWEKLDAELFSRRPDLTLRIFLATEYDLSFVAKLKNVRHFRADGLYHVTGVENVARLPELKSLAVGIYYLDSFEFLREASPRHLKSLWLYQTKSTKPSLGPLARFEKLRQVHIEGHRKDIEVLGQLPRIEDLTLRSVSTPDLTYLRPLSTLRSLDIKLGGIKSLSAIAGMESIRYLEIWQVKGLADIEVVGQLPGLQYLFLQSLSHVKKLPSFAHSKALRRVHLQNMRGLKDFSSLADAPALEELVVYEGEGLDPEDFEPVLARKTLNRAIGGFGSARKNERFLELAVKHGVRPVTGPFRFR